MNGVSTKETLIVSLGEVNYSSALAVIEYIIISLLYRQLRKAATHSLQDSLLVPLHSL